LTGEGKKVWEFPSNLWTRQTPARGILTRSGREATQTINGLRPMLISLDIRLAAWEWSQPKSRAQMKTIIDGKRYNTLTATLISNGSADCAMSDFRWFDESLYRTTKGQFSWPAKAAR
jgi:hypothetical protein